MNRYRVAAGTAKFGPGQQLKLSGAQIAGRKHNLELPKGYEDGKDAVVTAKVPLEFKVGEVIGLAALDRRMTEVLLPLDPPKSEADKVALAKDDERKASAKTKADDKPKAKAAAAQS